MIPHDHLSADAARCLASRIGFHVRGSPKVYILWIFIHCDVLLLSGSAVMWDVKWYTLICQYQKLWEQQKLWLDCLHTKGPNKPLWLQRMSGYSEGLQTGWKTPAPGSENKKIKHETKEHLTNIYPGMKRYSNSNNFNSLM